MPKDNRKQKLDQSYTNKYQEYVACSYGCKLVCVDERLSKPFKTYLCVDFVYNFVNSIIKESKYCSEVMNKHFNKELVMTKKKDEDFDNSSKCWDCDNNYVNGNVTIRDHFHITGKYRGSAHRD